MEFKKFGNKYILRLEKGEEIVETLKSFCSNQQIKLGQVNGIGAINKATIGLFDIENKEFHSSELTGSYEIITLTGNISTKDGKTYPHLHINVADVQHKTYGGHLSSAIISATGEIIIDAIEGQVDRELNEDIGLNLFKFNN